MKCLFLILGLSVFASASFAGTVGDYHRYNRKGARITAVRTGQLTTGQFVLNKLKADQKYRLLKRNDLIRTFGQPIQVITENPSCFKLKNYCDAVSRLRNAYSREVGFAKFQATCNVYRQKCALSRRH